jgi:type I restriction enzyme S subunit
MNMETFFEKFELFADAPDAVKRMRELILLLSVRGNLSEQFASESCEAQLSAARAFAKRKAKTFEGESTEAPFQIPENWGWVLVGHAMNLVNGTAFKPENWTTYGTPIVRIQNLNNPDAAFNRFNGEIESKFYINSGDFLISWSGTPGTSFGAFIWNRGKAILNQHIFRCELVEDVFVKEYLRLAVNSRLDEMISRAHGAVGLRHITKGKLETIPLPLPPLAEQKRIVAKVDELMALCDRLEAQQQERAERHAALARASLARFAEAPTPANLHFLFHPSYAIPPADLRKSILTLAVQGKLVPQDPNDEPAEVLTERIAAMRRVNKGKQYEPVLSDEVPYEVPFSWSWVRLGNIAMTSDSGWSPQCLPEARSGSDWGVLKVSAVSWGIFKPEENKALPQGMTSRPDCEVKAGDFLLSRANTEELVARSVVVDQTPPRLMMSDKIVRFTFPAEIERAFINLANMSDPSRAYYVRNASGTSSSMKNIGREVMCNLPIPLPPLAEQRRIVAKVEQLMALVDALEKQLQESRERGAKLLEALVAELTAG